MAWRYLEQPFPAYAPPLFVEEYQQPEPRIDQRPNEPPPGFTYQTILNSFALSELNANARPYLASITPWLPLELGQHSRAPVVAGRRIPWRQAEREREWELERGGERDPRFEWGDWPRTVGWEARRSWRERREVEERERLNAERAETARGRSRVDGDDLNGDEDDQIPSPGASNGSDEGADEIQNPEIPQVDIPNDVPQVDIQIDFRTHTVGRHPETSQVNGINTTPTANAPSSAPPTRKRVTWPRELKNRDTAPVVASRFEHYWQWAHRFGDLIMKMEQEEAVNKNYDPHYYTIDYDEDARSLEVGPPSSSSSRSKYNPKQDPDYHRPPSDPVFHLPMPKNDAQLIKPHVPRHRQAQPIKSSLLQRTGRRMRDALMSGIGMVVGGLRRGMGTSQARPTQGEGSGELQQGVVPSSTRPPSPLPADRASIPPAAVAPAAEDDEDKSDTERFYVAPPAPPSDSEEEDVLATLPLRSAGMSEKEKRRNRPAVTIHTTRSLDGGEVEDGRERIPAITTHTRRSLDDDIPDNMPSPNASPPAVILPEIGTGAARPMTRDNTAFNAAQLDFIPLPSDSPIAPSRPIHGLPPTATPREREVAAANERYHEYLRSLAAAERQDEGQVYREGDSWRDVEEDDAPRRGDDRGDRRRKRRRDDRSDSDWSDDGDVERRGREGRNGGRRRDESGEPDVEQPDEKPHRRFHSPPPEKRVLAVDEIDDDDDREDYAAWERRIQETLRQYNTRYEPDVVDSDDSDAVNSDFKDIDLDDDLELEIDEIEIPELGAAPLYGAGFNRDRVMPKIRRPDHDRERQRDYERRKARRLREDDERRGSRWASGRPGQRMYGGYGN